MATLADLKAAPLQYLQVVRSGHGNTAVGCKDSWLLAGGQPGAGEAFVAVPGAALTTPSTGAPTVYDPPSGKLWYLLEASIHESGSVGPLQQGTPFLIYDRLVQVGGLLQNATTEQTINTPTLPRRTSGVGVRAYYTCLTALGSPVASDFTLKYTNQAGTTGQTSVTNIPSATQTAIGRVWPFNLATGDTGVKVVESVTEATAGGTGTFGVILGYPLILTRSSPYRPRPSRYNGRMARKVNWLEAGLAPIEAGTVLSFMTMYPLAASTSDYNIMLTLAAL